MFKDWASLFAGICVIVAAVLTPLLLWWGAIIRAFSGHSIENLTVSLEVNRRPAQSENLDDLVVAIKLDKLAKHAISLRSLKAELFALDQVEFSSETVGCRPNNSIVWIPEPRNRSLNAAGKLCFERSILAIWTTEETRPLNLAPGEGTQYAAYCVVPSGVVFEILVTLTGIRYRYPWIRRILNAIRGPHVLYWTASTVSLPVMFETLESVS